MDEPERRPSPLVNALWGSAIVQPRPSREQLRATRWRVLGLLGVVWGLPIAVGVAVALVDGQVFAGMLAGGATLLAVFFVTLVVVAIAEPFRTRRQRAD